MKNARFSRKHPAPWGVILALGLLLSACTTTTIEPTLVTKPMRVYDTVFIGDIDSSEKIWQGRLPYFREGLVDKLHEAGLFTQVSDTVPETLPESAILVSGTVTEVDKGNKALRFLIGFGAGRARVEGNFAIADKSGVLARFTSAKAYSGGAGIGGIDMMDMDELMTALGEVTAESIIRWSKGESLEPPKKQE
ncbi:MAG: DUF4410 domain-containing protein [Alphaproteobacteria bacterium]|nr:MAG: DUF4410 domain-containing protein [Alphaproteobacteria bacterium]